MEILTRELQRMVLGACIGRAYDRRADRCGCGRRGDRCGSGRFGLTRGLDLDAQ